MRIIPSKHAVRLFPLLSVERLKVHVLRFAKTELSGERKRENRISTSISPSPKLQFEGMSALCLRLSALYLFIQEFRKPSLYIYSTSFIYLLSNPVKGKKGSTLSSLMLFCLTEQYQNKQEALGKDLQD